MRLGIFTYESLHCNFTNYGTVLQAWALQKAIDNMRIPKLETILINYCAENMLDKNPYDPVQNMWDLDPEIRKQCKAMLPAIELNYERIAQFYLNEMKMTSCEYNKFNLECLQEENIDIFVCGSDSIWDVSEFGIDKAFWADYDFMKGKSLAYAPSFQDSFEYLMEVDEEKLRALLNNYVTIGIRDQKPLEKVQEMCSVKVEKVCDPTMLLATESYSELIEKSTSVAPYILYYSRRYNPNMERFVYYLAKKKSLRVIEISLRACNSDRAEMRYDAGAQEFLSLISEAEYVVTNSFHCIIFSLHFEKKFWAFTRQNCVGKIVELLESVGLTKRLISTENYDEVVDEDSIDYLSVKKIMESQRQNSLLFLRQSIMHLVENL